MLWLKLNFMIILYYNNNNKKLYVLLSWNPDTRYTFLETLEKYIFFTFFLKNPFTTVYYHEDKHLVKLGKEGRNLLG